MSVRHKGEFDDEQIEEATDNLGKPADADQLSRFAGAPGDLVWDDDDEGDGEGGAGGEDDAGSPAPPEDEEDD